MDFEESAENIRPLTPEDLEILANDPDLVHLIGMLSPRRIGAVLFITKLEYDNYPPDTPENDKFKLLAIQWQGIEWFVASIPKEDFKKADKLAKLCRLRIADGIPVMVSGGDWEEFPINSPNAYHLVNDDSHPVYDSSSEQVAEMLRIEDEKIRDIILGYIEKLEQSRYSADNS